MLGLWILHCRKYDMLSSATLNLNLHHPVEHWFKFLRIKFQLWNHPKPNWCVVYLKLHVISYRLKNLLWNVIVCQLLKFALAWRWDLHGKLAKSISYVKKYTMKWNPTWNDACIAWLSDGGRLLQESASLKPHWFLRKG